MAAAVCLASLGKFEVILSPRSSMTGITNRHRQGHTGGARRVLSGVRFTGKILSGEAQTAFVESESFIRGKNVSSSPASTLSRAERRGVVGERDAPAVPTSPPASRRVTARTPHRRQRLRHQSCSLQVGCSRGSAHAGMSGDVATTHSKARRPPELRQPRGVLRQRCNCAPRKL